MNITQVRAEVIKRYWSPSWEKRVNKMPDSQVLAIHSRMVDESRNTNKEHKA